MMSEAGDLTEPVDVITVPDFEGPGARLFELRTLFFLASWLENAGAAKAFPLHVVCIGQPPRSVVQLAHRCDANIVVKEPMQGPGRAGRFWNKLRGLEVTPQTDRFLLLDTDILILSDFSRITSLGHCISAAPTFRARIPQRNWRHIYASLSIEPPTERMQSLIVQLNASRGSLWGEPRFDNEDHESQSMFPYFNGAVVYATWSSGLHTHWAQYITSVAHLFEHHSNGGVPTPTKQASRWPSRCCASKVSSSSICLCHTTPTGGTSQETCCQWTRSSCFTPCAG